MDDRTLTALKASIRHWEENVAAKKPVDAPMGVSACALCHLFSPFVMGCRGCPVSLQTGRSNCRGSPYDKALDAKMAWIEGKRGGEKRWRKAAQAELDFLKSLLPTEEKQP